MIVAESLRYYVHSGRACLNEDILEKEQCGLGNFGADVLEEFHRRVEELFCRVSERPSQQLHEEDDVELQITPGGLSSTPH